MAFGRQPGVLVMELSLAVQSIWRVTEPDDRRGATPHKQVLMSHVQRRSVLTAVPWVTTRPQPA